MSVNRPTIKQLKLACRHVQEMMAAKVTENDAIRTLELFADVYAKLYMGGSATPHHVNQVSLWSEKAIKVRKINPRAKAKDYFRVEHGTPRRAFARMVLNEFKKGNLTDKTMQRLVKKYWKLAVITIEEDQRLNKIARSRIYKSPEKRWAAAGIKLRLVD